MSTRWIVVPLDQQAMRDLDVDKAKPEQMREWLLQEDEFSVLWSSGILQQVNDVADVNIDGFEDERLVGTDQVRLMTNVLIQRLAEAEGQLRSMLVKLIELCELAALCGTGIFFFF